MLIIEDGTMPEGANSYVSLEDADTYLVMRGLWDTTPEAEGESIKLNIPRKHPLQERNGYHPGV